MRRASIDDLVDEEDDDAAPPAAAAAQPQQQPDAQAAFIPPPPAAAAIRMLGYADPAKEATIRALLQDAGPDGRNFPRAKPDCVRI